MRERVLKVGDLDLENEACMICAICDGEMDLRDFQAGQAILQTGEREDVISHVHHFYVFSPTGEPSPAASYSESVEKLAFEYGRRQGWIPQQ